MSFKDSNRIHLNYPHCTLKHPSPLLLWTETEMGLFKPIARFLKKKKPLITNNMFTSLLIHKLINKICNSMFKVAMKRGIAKRIRE